MMQSLLERAKDTAAGLRHVMPTSSYIDHMNITVARREHIVGDGRPTQHFKISRCAAERDDLGDAEIGFGIAISKQAAVSLRNGDESSNLHHGLWLEPLVEPVAEPVFRRTFVLRTREVILAVPRVLHVDDVRQTELPLPVWPERHDRKHRRRKVNEIVLPQSE